ncbi:MAG: hypothetical protein ACM3JJ_04445 [Hyphomicrobiales bacterium]
MSSRHDAESLGARLARAFGRAPRPVRQDGRGHRLIAVIECILNQNARDAGAASFRSMVDDVVRLCEEHGVGLLQMPCPEIAYLGPERARERGESIRDALDTPGGRLRCADIASDVADRIEAYVRAGYDVVAVLGGNPKSPGCAVNASAEGLLRSSGILMQALEVELGRRDIAIPFRGIRDADPAALAEDVAWLRAVLAGEARAGARTVQA